MLVDPTYWKRLIEEFEDLADSLAVTQEKLTIARQEEKLIDWKTVKQELNASSKRGKDDH